MLALVAIALAHEVCWNVGRCIKREQALPGFRPPRKDHIARGRITPDVDLFFLEAIFERKAHGLAAPGREDFGRLCHGHP